MASKRRKKKGGGSGGADLAPVVNASGEELSTLLERQPGAIVVVGGEGETLYLNSAAAKLLKKRANQLLNAPFPFPLEEGAMQDLDVDMKLDEVVWAGSQAQVVFLRPLKVSQAPFHIEWRIESALERAREAEARLKALEGARPAPDESLQDRLGLLEEQLAEASAEVALLKESKSELEQQLALQEAMQAKVARAEERVTELEGLLEAAEQRADEALAQATDASHESVDRLQEALRSLEEMETQLRDTEERAREAEERIASAEEQAEEAEERAYETEGLLEAAERRAEEAEARLAELQEAGGEEGESELLREELQQAREDLEELREMFEAAQVKAAEAEELDDLRTELESARTRAERVADLETELEELRESLEATLERAEEAERQLARTEQAGEDSDEVAELKEKLDDAEKRVKKAGVRFREAEARARRAEEDLEKLRGQSGEGASDTALQEELERVRAQLEKARELAGGGDVEKLERQLEGALARAAESEERLVEAQSLIDQLKQVSSARIAELEAQLQSVAGDESPLPSGADPETERLAFQDDLTGLPNVNIIKRYLDFMLKQAERYSRACALLSIDVDRFKLVNDALGFKIGDELLRLVAERLTAVVRGSDVLGRRGEDEFIILLSELSGQEEATSMAAAVARRVYEVLRAPFTVGDQKIHIGVSVGISLYPTDSRSAQQMLEHADTSMYRAKELGRGRYQFYTPELQARHESRLKLDVELREGVERGEFRVVYQPIFNLGTGQMVGVESLLRWAHPTRGVLAPADFLEECEETGLIVPIGRMAILNAVEQAKRWELEGLNLFVTINLSRRQLLQADLSATLLQAVQATGANPASLVLEIGEDVTQFDTPRVQENLDELRRAGLSLAIDRFGTGYSSLERLHADHSTLLKIDRKFVAGVPEDERSTQILLAALSLARNLKMRAVVVGIENRAQKQLLMRLECEFGQGNFLSEPADADTISQIADRVFS